MSGKVAEKRCQEPFQLSLYFWNKGSSLLLTFRDLARYYFPHVPSPAD